MRHCALNIWNILFDKLVCFCHTTGHIVGVCPGLGGQLGWLVASDPQLSCHLGVVLDHEAQHGLTVVIDGLKFKLVSPWWTPSLTTTPWTSCYDTCARPTAHVSTQTAAKNIVSTLHQSLASCHTHTVHSPSATIFWCQRADAVLYRRIHTCSGGFTNVWADYEKADFSENNVIMLFSNSR